MAKLEVAEQSNDADIGLAILLQQSHFSMRSDSSTVTAVADWAEVVYTPTETAAELEDVMLVDGCVPLRVASKLLERLMSDVSVRGVVW